jgi:hypothetical protein
MNVCIDVYECVRLCECVEEMWVKSFKCVNNKLEEYEQIFKNHNEK